MWEIRQHAHALGDTLIDFIDSDVDELAKSLRWHIVRKPLFLPPIYLANPNAIARRWLVETYESRSSPCQVPATGKCHG